MSVLARVQERYLRGRRRRFSVDAEAELPTTTRAAHALWRLADIVLAAGPAPVPSRLQRVRDPARGGEAADLTPTRLYVEDFLRATVGECLPRGAPRVRLLDLGCGDGSYARELRDRLGFHAAWGIDVRARAAWQGHEGAVYVVADAARPPFHRGSHAFDLVVSVHVLEHVADDEAVLREIAGSLATTGVAVVMVPSTQAFLLYGFHGFRGYSPRSFAHLCRAAGLSLVSVHRQGGAISFLLHLVAISLSEIYGPLILRMRPRRAGRGRPGFAALLEHAVRLDRGAPLLASSYAFVVRRAGSAELAGARPRRPDAAMPRTADAVPAT